MSELAAPRASLIKTLGSFTRPFWMGCTMEMWERLAYYGVRVVVPIYIAQADDPGGLQFSQAQKATIFFWWALVQSLVPMVSGGIADRYGYKNTVFVSVCFKVAGYLLMATQRSYAGFFFGCMVLAFGTAVFKPGLQGTLATAMTKQNSSVGWGLFYWLVNVGAAIGPPFAGFLHAKGWPWVFYGCAAVVSLNFLMLFSYREVSSGADLQKRLGRVVFDTLRNLLDLRLLCIIGLFSGFWMMLYQLWDLMPNFYADWTDSRAFVANNPWLPSSWLTNDARGVQLKQENALNLNSLMVVLFVVPISAMVARLRVLSTIAIGILIATLGTLVYGTSPSLYVLAGGIALFSLGEMLTGPKKSEYFALIAPAGKKALYLGYVNIPIAIGQALGALLAGFLYGTRGEKATLALRYLAESTELGRARGVWNGDVHGLEAFLGISRSEAMPTLMRTLGQDANHVTAMLWDTYRPYQVWYPFAAIGLASLIGVVAFGRISRRWKDLDV